MKRTSNIAFFFAGLAVFCYLVWQFGVNQIVGNVERAGWSLLYVIVIWLAIYLLNTLAWSLALGEHRSGVSFSKLFAVTVSGFVLNYITPIVALGGEPYKVKALNDLMKPQQSVSAVVLYRMVHLLGHMLLLLTGILVTLVSLSLPSALNVVLCTIGCLILGIIALTFSGHRHGVFERLQGFIKRIALFRKAAAGLQKYDGSLQQMDAVITDVYRRQRVRFYLAIVVEYASRACMCLEVYVILRSVGVESTVTSALFIYLVYSIIINVLFFIPLNLGAREGGLYLGLESLTLPPLLGVYLGVVMRIREFFWILLGLLFIVLSSSKKRTSTASIL